MKTRRNNRGTSREVARNSRGRSRSLAAGDLERIARRTALAGLLCGALCAAASCTPFYAGLSAGGTPDEVEDRDLILNALLIAVSVRPTRSIFLTNSIFDGDSDGDFGVSNGMGIDDADRHCMADSARPFQSRSYAALLSDGLSRVATTSPNCQAGCTGQLDWPLRAYTDYVLPDGRLFFTTGAAPLFVFGRLPAQLTTLTGATHWTGLQSDWTPAGNCQQWTNNAALTGRTGSSTAIDNAWLTDSEQNCGLGARYICVQL